MDAEGGGGGRMKRPVVVEDFLREPRERGSSSGRCQDRCLYTGRGIFGEKHSRSLVAGAVRIFPPSLYTNKFVFKHGPRGNDDSFGRRGRLHLGEFRTPGVLCPTD